MRRILALALLLSALPMAGQVRTRAVRSAPSLGDWMRQRAIPLGSPAALDLTRGSRVVALGDATHGTHELYASKQTLVPMLVAQGFRVIAFEAPFAEWERLDRYVTHGDGDPAELLASRPYWFWDTDEVLALLRWGRSQNAAGMQPPIRVAGVDATMPLTDAAAVVARLERLDPAVAAFASQQYGCIQSPANAFCASLVSSVQGRIAALSGRIDAADFAWLMRAARVVELGVEVGAGLTTRDAALAENILDLARGDRVIVWGHNEHWGRTSYRLLSEPLITPAGAYLSTALGDSYVAIGSVLLEGTFLAVEQTTPGRFRVMEQVMVAPAANDYATLFAATGVDSVIVPLRGSPLPPYGMVRIAGSSVLSRDRATLSLPQDLASKFDAVLFIRRSTPTRLRTWPVW